MKPFQSSNVDAISLYSNFDYYLDILIKIVLRLFQHFMKLNTLASVFIKYYLSSTEEWVSTAQNLIARQSIGQHFWQEINCSTQNLSTA